jgi:lipoic acid synthetase
MRNEPLEKPLPKPPWLKKRLPLDGPFRTLEHDLRANRLHTVCQEALCPNRGECFTSGVATFLIMGNVCTRDCRFCAVRPGRPLPLDPDEPARVAAEVKHLGLRFAVITSVTRDDLPDGGATHFVRVIQAIRKECQEVGIEILVPDFMGAIAALDLIAAETPEVINHNIETVPRLYPAVRPQAEYDRSLRLLERVKEKNHSVVTKSGLMVGLGEKKEEVIHVMDDLHRHHCDLLTIGQYLSPSKGHFPVKEYIHPETFDDYAGMALAMGFKAVASGPFVRSSYEAEALYQSANQRLISHRDHRERRERPLCCVQTSEDS